MTTTIFSEHGYFPALRTRRSELELGYGNLPDADKDKLTPLVGLCRWPRQDTMASTIDRIGEILGGRRFFADICKDRALLTRDFYRTFDEDDAYGAWRDVAATMPGGIPMVQCHVGRALRPIIQQALALERAHGSIGLRIPPNDWGRTLALGILTALDAPTNATIFIDSGFITQINGNDFARDIVTTINALRDEVPEVFIVGLSTSFPRTVTPFGENEGEIPNLDRSLHKAFSTEAVFCYGDHASIHVEPYDIRARGVTPRIDYPNPESWVYERHAGREDGRGYRIAGERLMARGVLQGAPDIWGVDQIKAAAEGDVGDRTVPAFWIGVRVNIHLHQQLHYARASGQDEDW